MSFAKCMYEVNIALIFRFIADRFGLQLTFCYRHTEQLTKI
jgi:hypothetical protein